MRDFLLAQTIKACVLGIKAAEADDRSPRDFLEVLSDLARTLEGPRTVEVVLDTSKIPDIVWNREELERGRAM